MTRLLLVGEGSHELGDDWESGDERVDDEPDDTDDSPDLFAALETLVRRLIPPAELECERERIAAPIVRRHQSRGKAPKLLKRLLGWVQYAIDHHFDAIVIVFDEDGKRERRRSVDQAQEDTRQPIPRAIGIAIRQFDAWMLADEQALTRVLSMPVSKQRSPERIPDPKAVLCKLIDDSPRSERPRDLYAQIAAAANIELIARVCPNGFAPFAERVRHLAGAQP